MDVFFKIILGGIVTFDVAIMQGFTLVKLWGWFIVPIFDVSILRVPEAIGIILVISLVRLKISKEDDENFTSKTVNVLTTAIVGCGFFLLFGYIIYQFI